MIKPLNSVPVKLSLRFMVMLTVAVLSLSVLFSIALRHSVRVHQDKDLEHAAQKIMIQLRAGSDSFEVPYFISYVVYKEDTMEAVYTNDPFLPQLKSTEGRTRPYLTKDFFIDGDLNILYYAEPFEEKRYVVETALNMDTDSASLLLKGLPRTLVFAVIPVLLLSFFASFIITKNTIKPVVRMTQAAKDIGSRNLDRRLPVKHKDGQLDENDELAVTFNDLFARLEKDFEREKNFTGDVSHELKTPVAVILGQSNLLRRWGKDDAAQLEKSLGIIIKEAHSMESIITNLLQLSRLESGRQKPVMELFNPDDFFALLKEEVHSYAPDAAVHVSNEVRGQFLTDRELLHQVCTVIISNSIKFTQSAGTVPELQIHAQTDPVQNMAVIAISDNGPGFSEEALPHVFERFYRGDSSHNRKAGGSGLGLSIAKTIMTVLGGTIAAGNKAEGGAELILGVPSSAGVLHD